MVERDNPYIVIDFADKKGKPFDALVVEKQYIFVKEGDKIYLVSQFGIVGSCIDESGKSLTYPQRKKERVGLEIRGFAGYSHIANYHDVIYCDSVERLSKAKLEKVFEVGGTAHMFEQYSWMEE